METLVRKICRTYASKSIKYIFKHRVSFCAIIRHDYAEAYESHQTENFNNAHNNLEQKYLKASDCVTNIKSQPYFRQSGRDTVNWIWREIFMKIKHGLPSKTGDIEGTSYVPLQLNHKSF